jgi:hypothetical protein
MTHPPNAPRPHQDRLACEALRDPATSFWLKHTLATALTRDPLDALRDAETLVHILKARVNQLLGAPTSCNRGP